MHVLVYSYLLLWSMRGSVFGLWLKAVTRPMTRKFCSLRYDSLLALLGTYIFSLTFSLHFQPTL